MVDGETDYEMVDRETDIVDLIYHHLLPSHHLLSPTISTGNILLCDDGRIGLIDFGQVRDGR